MISSNLLPVISVDLDDTLHQAEWEIMARRWNHVLEPFGVVWERYGQDRESFPPGTRFSEDLGKPGVGVATPDVIRFFINQYQLDIDYQLTEENMKKAGFGEETIKAILKITTEDKVNQVVKILDREGERYSQKLIEKGGYVKPVPGAPEMVKRLQAEGFRICVITQTSLPLAYAILEQLGLIQYDEEGRKKEWDIDFIVTRRMVERPKPAPDAFRKAEWLYNIHSTTFYERREIRFTLTENRERIINTKTRGGPFLEEEKRTLRELLESLTPQRYKLVGHIGDSLSDVLAGGEFGVPVVIIKTQYNSREMILQIAKEKGVQVTYVESPTEVSSRLFEGQILGEGKNPHKESL